MAFNVFGVAVRKDDGNFYLGVHSSTDAVIWNSLEQAVHMKHLMIGLSATPQHPYRKMKGFCQSFPKQ